MTGVVVVVVVVGPSGGARYDEVSRGCRGSGDGDSVVLAGVGERILERSKTERKIVR